MNSPNICITKCNNGYTVVVHTYYDDKGAQLKEAIVQGAMAAQQAMDRDPLLHSPATESEEPVNLFSLEPDNSCFVFKTWSQVILFLENFEPENK